MKISKSTRISELQFSIRAMNYLTNLKVSTLGELTALSTLENPFVYLSHSKAEKEILGCLETLGLKLGMSDEEWMVVEEK